MDQIFLSELLTQFNILYTKMHYHSKNYFQGVLTKGVQIRVHTIDYLDKVNLVINYQN